MTQKPFHNMISNGSAITQQPHPEVVPKPNSVSSPLWVLEEADKCQEQPGQIGVLLEMGRLGRLPKYDPSSHHDYTIAPGCRALPTSPHLVLVKWGGRAKKASDYQPYKQYWTIAKPDGHPFV